MSKVILFSIPNLYGGGAERVVSLWASQLAQIQNYSIHILVSGRVANEYITDKNVVINTISSTYEDYEKLSILTKIKRRRELIKQIKPDYIISFLPHIQIQTFVSTIGLRVKRIETIRVSPWVIKLNKLNKIIWDLCINTCYKLIIQTAEQGLYFSPRVQAKSVVIPNPVNELYNRHFKRTQPESVKSFIAVGRITPQKNFPMMIRAFAQVCMLNPDITLDIYGEEESPSYKAGIENLIFTLGVENNIRLRGRCNHIHEEYINHDAFLMSSNSEGMPNSLLEAMACGMVCLSTDCKTGPKDMIDHGDSGYLSPINDPHSFASSIQQILQMTQAERQRMGEKSREKICSMCSSANSLKLLTSCFE